MKEIKRTKQTGMRQKTVRALWSATFLAVLVCSLTIVVNATLVTTTTLSDGRITLAETAESAANGSITWTPNGDEITVTATTTDSSCENQTSGTVTLTVTAATNDQILTFNSTKPTSGTFTIAYDGASYTDAGLKTVSIPANKSKTITISVETEKGKNKTTSAEITSILLKNASVSVTFLPSADGIYTVDGSTTVSGESVTQQVSTVKATALAASPASANNVFSHWVWKATDGSGKSGAWVGNTIIPDYPCTIEPIFVPTSVTKKPFTVGRTQYALWEGAVAAAAAVSGGGTVILNQDYDLPTTLEENCVPNGGGYVTEDANGTIVYTLPAGAKFLVPYNDGNTASFTAEPDNNYEVTQKNSSDRLRAGKNIAECYRTLTVPTGTRIESFGDINVNGQRQKDGQPYTGVSAGSYGKIILGEETFADPEEADLVPQLVMHSGNLYCYGYITGTGMVQMKSGSAIRELMQICDWPGGGDALDWSDKATGKDALFLLSNYYLQNVEAPLKMEYGATGYGEAVLTVSGFSAPASAPYAGDGVGIFDMGEGSHFTRVYDHTEDRVHYHLCGNSNFGEIKIYKKIGWEEVDLNSSEYVLPIANNMSVHVEDGANLTLDKRIAVMPDAEIIVKEGGTVSGSGKAYLVDAKDWTYSHFFNRSTFLEDSNGAKEGNYALKNTAPKFAPLPYVATMDGVSPRGTDIKGFIDLASDGEKSYRYYVDAKTECASGKLVVDGTLDILTGGGLYTTVGNASSDKMVEGTGVIKLADVPAAGPDLYRGYSSLSGVKTGPALGDMAGIGIMQPFATNVQYSAVELGNGLGRWYNYTATVNVMDGGVPVETYTEYFAHGADLSAYYTNEECSEPAGTATSNGMTLYIGAGDFTARVDWGDGSSTKFLKLNEAMGTAEANDVVVVLKDISLGSGLLLPKGKTTTLDLNGHTVTYNGTAVRNDGTLTIRGGGTITGASTSSTEPGSTGRTENYAETVLNVGTLTLDGVTIKQTGKSTYSAALVNHDTGVIPSMKNTTVQNTTSNGYAISNLGGTITLMEDCTVKGYRGLYNRNIASSRTFKSAEKNTNKNSFVKDADVAEIGMIVDCAIESTSTSSSYHALYNAGRIKTITGKTTITGKNGSGLYNGKTWFYDAVVEKTRYMDSDGDGKENRHYYYGQETRPTIEKITGEVTIESTVGTGFFNEGFVDLIEGTGETGVTIRTDGHYYGLRNYWKIADIHGKVTIFAEDMAISNGAVSSGMVDDEYAASQILEYDYDAEGTAIATKIIYDFGEYGYPWIGNIGGLEGDEISISSYSTYSSEPTYAIMNNGVIDLIGKGTTVTAEHTVKDKNAYAIYVAQDRRVGMLDVRTDITDPEKPIKISDKAYDFVTMVRRTYCYDVDRPPTIKEINGVTIGAKALTVSKTNGVRNLGYIGKILNTTFSMTGYDYAILNSGDGYFSGTRDTAQIYGGTSSRAASAAAYTSTYQTDGTVQRTPGKIDLIDGCTINNRYYGVHNGGYIDKITNNTIKSTGYCAISNSGRGIAHTVYNAATTTYTASSSKYTTKAGTAASTTYGSPGTIELIGEGNVISGTYSVVYNTGRIEAIDSGDGVKTTIRSSSTTTTDAQMRSAIQNRNGLVIDGVGTGASIGRIANVQVTTASYPAITNYYNSDDWSHDSRPNIELISEGVIAVSAKDYAVLNNSGCTIELIEDGDYRGKSGSAADRVNVISDVDGQIGYPEGKMLSSKTRSTKLADGSTVETYYLVIGSAGIVTGDSSASATKTHYETLAAAIAAYEALNDRSNSYVVLMQDTKETANITATKDLYLDLNGYDVNLNGHTLIMGSNTLYGMDTTTNGYSDEKIGKILGTVSGEVAAVAEPENGVNAGKSYVAVTASVVDAQTQAAVTETTFHRVNITPTKYLFYFYPYTDSNPNGHSHLAFEATYQGDAAVSRYLSDAGFALSLNGGTPEKMWYGKNPAPGDVFLKNGDTITFVAMDYAGTEGFDDEITVQGLIAFNIGGTRQEITGVDDPSISFLDALKAFAADTNTNAKAEDKAVVKAYLDSLAQGGT